MPILPAEPEFFPEDLWADDLEGPGPGRWWCLHTKPRQEKATARHLLAGGIAHYLPQVAREGRTPRGRAIRSVLPLFPCYVFMRGDEHQRLEAFQGGTLANVLEIVDQASIRRDLRQIRRMLESGLPVSLEPSHPVGVRVRITSGPLSGIVGTVIRRGTRDRFVAVVNFIGSGGAVDLHDWQVEPVSTPA